MSDVIREWTERLTYEGLVLRESQLRAIIRPRPRWIPEWVWRRLIARVLYLEERS